MDLPFKRYTRRSRDSSSDKNRLRETVEGLDKAARPSQGPLATSQRAGVPQYASTEDLFFPFYVQVLGGSGNPYTSWIEVERDANGTWFSPEGALEGDGTFPAYEINDQQIPANAFCLARFASDGESLELLYAPSGPTVRADDGPDIGPRRRLNFHSDLSGALTIGAVDDPGSGEIDVSFTFHPSALPQPAYPVGLSLSEPDYAEPFPQPPGQPTSILVTNGGGFSAYGGINILVFDHADGYAVSQTAPAQATLNLLDATETQRGIVSLMAQYLGSGNKYFKDKVGVGFTTPTVPLTNSALDVRGHTYSYFAGALSFGGGNSPTVETDGAILKYTATGRKVVCEVPTAAQFAGQAVGYEVQGNGCAFVLRYQDAGDTLPCFAIYNDLTATFYAVGGTATVGGMVFKGGLYASGTPSLSLQIGVTPISGGSTDDFLRIDSAGHLNSVAPGLTTTF